MGNKLYIGNLPFSVDSTELEELFGQIGTVTSAKVITDRDSGRSKGFAFVEMASPEEAKAGIEKFNGFSHGGRQLNVTEAKPQAPRESRGGGFGGGGGGGRGGGGFGGGGGGRY